MPLLLITSMTCGAIVTFVWLISSSQHTNLYSLRNLFLAGWLYYGFAIGIDIFGGTEIPYISGEVHMMDASTWDDVAFVMACYWSCGIAFLVTYFVLQGRQEMRPIKLEYELVTPPEWAMILLHLAAAYVYVQVFFDMDRMERIAMSQLHLSYKFATLLVPITLAVDILVVLSGNQRKAVVAMTLALLLSLLTGNRSYVMFIVLIAVFHWQPALRGWRLVSIVGASACMVFAFKTVYALGLAWWIGDRVDLAMAFENLVFTLSGLDAHASYSIAVFYTGFDSPLWLGESYFQTPLLLAWPRFLGGLDVTTLAEDYVWKYHAVTAERGGALAFSAIAEAWLNFSYLGPVLLGVFWGAVTNFFDRRPRGICYFIVLLMVARLFRSDAASLFKNWILVWGTMFLVAITLLTLYSVIVDPKRAAAPGRLEALKPIVPGPRLGDGPH